MIGVVELEQFDVAAFGLPVGPGGQTAGPFAFLLLHAAGGGDQDQTQRSLFVRAGAGGTARHGPDRSRFHPGLAVACIIASGAMTIPSSAMTGATRNFTQDSAMRWKASIDARDR